MIYKNFDQVLYQPNQISVLEISYMKRRIDNFDVRCFYPIDTSDKQQ